MSTTPRFSTPWLRAFALWAQALSAEGNPLGDVLKNYADKWADDLAAQSQPEAQPVATIIACSEVDLDGNPRMERDIEWHEGDIADLPVGTKLYAGPAAPQSEAQPEPDDYAALLRHAREILVKTGTVDVPYEQLGAGFLNVGITPRLARDLRARFHHDDVNARMVFGTEALRRPIDGGPK